MTINPAAVVLLVVGFLAIVVGVKGSQKKVGQLLTGVGIDSGGQTQADAGAPGAGHVTLASATLPSAVHHTGTGTYVQAGPGLRRS